MTKTWLVLLALFGMVGTACSRTVVQDRSDRGIAVTVSGSARVSWDTVDVIVKTRVRGPSGPVAISRAGDLVDALTRDVHLIVPKADVSVRDFTRGVYHVSPKEFETQYWTDVRFHDPNDADGVLRVVYGHRAGGVQGWELQIEPASSVTLLPEARKDALAKARIRAAELARDAGVRVGTPIAIRETGARIPKARRVSVEPFTEQGLAAMITALKARPLSTMEEVVGFDVRFEIVR